MLYSDNTFFLRIDNSKQRITRLPRYKKSTDVALFNSTQETAQHIHFLIVLKKTSQFVGNWHYATAGGRTRYNACRLH